MGAWKTFWTWAAKRSAKYAGIPLRDPALVALLGHQPTESGVDVDEAAALNISAVWQAVNVYSNSISTLPLGVFKEEGDGNRVLAKDHPVYELLFDAPNPEMTPVVFFGALQSHLQTWGNAYAFIERETEDPDSKPVALWPVLPNQMQPDRDHVTGDLFYRFQAMFPGEESRDDIQPWEVLHVPGLGFDGIRGYSVVQLAREGLGLSLATERFGAAFFGRGCNTTGVIHHPGELEESARKNLRESWEMLYRGPGNAHRIAVLEEGMTYQKMSIPPDDAQFLETRKFQIVEIARWFNLPPYMLRDLDGATFSNIEHQGIEFLVYSLSPWLVKWQQELKRKLFSPPERKVFYVEHDVTSLLKTDTNARYNSYQVGLSGGWLTLNDVLRKENMNLLPSKLGNARVIPENMRVFDENGNEIQREQRAQDESQHVAPILAVLTAVSAGQILPESGKALIGTAFPTFSQQALDTMFAGPLPSAKPLPAPDHEGRSALTAFASVAVKLAAKLGTTVDKINEVAFRLVAKNPAWDLPSLVNAILDQFRDGDPADELRALRVPDVCQSSDDDCGLACVRSVVRFFGVDESRKVFARLAQVKGGLKPEEVRDALKEHKLSVADGSMSFDGLTRQIEMGRPVVCPIRAGSGDETYGHWVVVRGVYGRQVQLQDPAYGPVSMPRDRFLERWHDTDRDGIEYKQHGIAAWR